MRAPRLLASIGAALLFACTALAQGAAERGRYIFDAAGCLGCHTDEKAGIPALAGGPGLHTPFGVFFAPNITPHPEAGIGRWSEAAFLTALQRGIGPDGKHYFPVFPYPSYTKARPEDLRDLFAFLKTVPPSDKPSRPHEVKFPFSLRMAQIPWQWLNFTPGEWQPVPGRDAVWNRGAYLVEALLHCGECHTPRNIMGGLDRSRWLTGARLSVDNLAPNLTSGAGGLGDWSASDIADSLSLGMSPKGDFFGNEMAEVVRNSTSKLTREDRAAIAAYIKALPAQPTSVSPASR